MKKYKKITAILLLAILGSILTGCQSSEIDGDRKSEELLQYLNDKDEKGLKSMFCNSTKSSTNFDNQIEEVMDFFEGEITTEDPEIITSSGGSVRGGKTKKIHISPHITNVETDAGKSYDIKFYSYLVNTEYEDKVGISKLLIKSEDGKECVVGEYIE